MNFRNLDFYLSEEEKKITVLKMLGALRMFISTEKYNPENWIWFIDGIIEFLED